MANRQRVVALEGGRNFRDLGGYATADGRNTRWGVLYRSGSLAGLTLTDWSVLQAHGVRAVCDLRTSRERAAEPFAWQGAPGLAYYARDYVSSFGELRQVMASDLPTAAAARSAMLTGYRELPFEQAPAYRRIFQHLASNEVPLILNCSAGKDRAGTAAALILSALGVPRATIVEDFVLTNTAVDLHNVLLDRTGSNSMLSKRPPEVVAAILQADPAYLAHAFDEIAARHGSIERYLQVVLGVDDAALDSMRRNLLE